MAEFKILDLWKTLCWNLIRFELHTKMGPSLKKNNLGLRSPLECDTRCLLCYENNKQTAYLCLPQIDT